MYKPNINSKSFFALFRADAERLHYVSGSKIPLNQFRMICLALRPELLVMFLYRVSYYLYSRGWQKFANLIYRINLTLTGADISPDSNIGAGCLIAHTVGVVIDADIGENCTLFAHTIIEPIYHDGKWSKRPSLGRNVSVNALACVLGDVCIADDVVIGPYSLIDQSIGESNCLVSDIPGKKRTYVRNNLGV